MKAIRVLFMLFCVILAHTAFGQSPEGLVSFDVYAPESVTQGGKVRITYVIKSRNLEVSTYPAASGGRLVNVDNDYELVDGVIHKNTIYCDYEVYCNGTLNIAPFEFKVDGQNLKRGAASVVAKPNPQYGEEWTLAWNYLYALCGYEGNDLQYKYGYTTQYAFSDEKAKVFAIIVAKEYQPYIADPILAYGVGNPMWNGVDNAKDNSIYAIMSRYDGQLKYLKRNKEVYRTLVPTSYEPDPDGVEPLLAGIEYGQRHPYNLYFPKESRIGRDTACVAGCGPVALAQVLTYYKSSVQPSGHADFTMKSGKKLCADLEDYRFAWRGMSQLDTGALLFASAASVRAEMGSAGTSSSLVDFKPALICHWGYDPKAKLVEKYFDFSSLAMIYEELDNGRPVIVADDAHCFVCDGYYRDFLHYNLGWNGYCNGYYRAIVIPSAEERQLPFEQMLIGIQPMDRTGHVRKTVTLSEPGTLTDVLSDKEKKNVTNLTVRGYLNGDDIKLLRQMAGATYLNYYAEWIGSLMSLDLSDAVIVQGGDYFTDVADGYSIFGTASKDNVRFDYEYKFPVSDAQWDQILKYDLHKRADCMFQKGTDGKYYIVYFTDDNVIGTSMFRNCHNLKEVHLPKSAVSVGRRVFYGCRALQAVYFSGSFENVDSDALDGAPNAVWK